VAAAAPQPVTLNVNGKDHKLTLEPRVTLLDALRNDLNYSGCKEVCTTVNCGACTVLIDGKPVLACSRFAIAEQGKKITTVEGLNAGGTPDKVVHCFVKHDATQCGYCTPGFVVAVRGFCDMHPNATLEDVKKGLGGNLCRCGTYVGVIEAALECAKR
jgi:xanthine dehydrogenase YagT iron-sulfur-binding subunit